MTLKSSQLVYLEDTSYLIAKHSITRHSLRQMTLNLRNSKTTTPHVNIEN